jgi:hypothetical protein
MAELLWGFAKNWNIKKRLSEQEKRRRAKPSVSDILQSVVLSCSDTQVFMGGAYALALRYYRGCSITAYHYNIVANMMLLSCGTHLMSITIVRNYWAFPFLALVRSLCIFGVFFVTGLLLANENSQVATPFPTKVPARHETDSLLFLPAACFQAGDSTFRRTLQDSFKDGEQARKAFILSQPGNRIQGWNFYLVILLWYGVALLAEVVRFVRRSRTRPGWRARLHARLVATAQKATTGKRPEHGAAEDGHARQLRAKSCLSYLMRAARTVYLIGGIGIGATTVVLSAMYMMNLRSWVSNSGWLRQEHGMNPEEDATTFG